MGVAGVGKSTVARALAQQMGARFMEGDDFHPAANIQKMQSGQPLDDNDRAGWLAALAHQLAVADGSVVLACSALKKSYRDRLLADVSGPHLIVLLKAPAAVIRQRLERRPNHFMPASLLDSQLAILEPPADAIVVDATLPLDRILAAITEPH